jgi:hypothetical protein
LADRDIFISRHRHKLPTWLILLGIGAGRTLIVWLFDYHQTVTEYGVHWNFFITMAFVMV